MGILIKQFRLSVKKVRQLQIKGLTERQQKELYLPECLPIVKKDI